MKTLYSKQAITFSFGGSRSSSSLLRFWGGRYTEITFINSKESNISHQLKLEN